MNKPHLPAVVELDPAATVNVDSLMQEINRPRELAILGEPLSPKALDGAIADARRLDEHRRKLLEHHEGELKRTRPTRTFKKRLKLSR